MASSSLRWGRVAAIHPEDYSLDLVMTDDGSHLAGVQVLTPSGSTNTGYNDLPKPATPASGDVWDLRQTTDRDVLAGVAFFGQYPVVLGFRYPQVCQMLFADLERRINRHASDVYSTTDAQGNTEWYHPSGTFVRVATNPAHEDLTGKDVDGLWKIARNTGQAVHLQVTVASGGGAVASLHIDPAGNVTLTHSGSLTVNTSGSANVTAGGPATVKTPSATVDAPETTCTGNLTVDGSASIGGGLAVQGNGGASSTMSGNFAIEGGSLTHNGKNIGSTHEHSGVVPGGGNTGAPV